MNVPVASERPGRRLALVKPAAAADERVAHAMQLLDSILWAFQGTTHSIWTIADVAEADVFVIHEHDTDERIEGWKAQGKPVIQIVTDRRPDPPNPDLLVYPFRPAQVLALLEKLDTRLSSGEQLVAAVEAQPDELGDDPDPWSFVESLRTLRSVSNSEAWLVARQGKMSLLWLRGDAVTYTADATTVQAIRRGGLRLSRLKLQKANQPTDAPALRSGMELGWFAGYHASEQLAPALQGGAQYRITRWPNFGLIRPLPSQTRVAAGLASVPADLAEIIKRADVTIEEATRTLNALHGCGVLVAVRPGEVIEKTGQYRIAQQSRGGIGKFLTNIRKHLGLGR